ncbi:hypothetical protein [Acetobacter tropicalis]|uniref:Uncharacterized protein n=1 Tax=Acetobacter tropicalis TaxID=104102 RepID=A0A252A8P9_9PROT|nr:hypothetical protein [Acetobacter tropicalis]OUI85944.1 hypothetical protein HC62_07145 [Acetobacter tropicalis]
MSVTVRSSASSPTRKPFKWGAALRVVTVLSAFGIAGCAESPEQKAYQQTLQTAQTDPNFCYSNRYDGVLAEAWQRVHSTQGNGQKDKTPAEAAPLPAVSVTGATSMPELSVPPYSQRSCRLSVKVGDAAPETGFLTFTYLVRDNVTKSALAEWHPDTEITEKYDALMEKIKAGVDMNNPDLKACITRYPAFNAPSSDPMVQKAAVDLRAHLVRRCLANRAALKNLYSDLYFIHR